MVEPPVPNMVEKDDEGPAPHEVMEGGRLRPAFVADVTAALEAVDPGRVRTMVDQLHPADIADLIELIPIRYRDDLLAALGDKLDAEAISELNDWVRDEVLEDLAPGVVADVVTQLDTDDAVAIIEDMEAEQQEQVLSAMPAEERAAIEEALTYPEDSAGRLMQRDLIAVPEYWTVGQVIDFLRENQALATEFWEIFVVDPGHKPLGTMRLSWVLRSPRNVLVSDLMQREQTLIPVEMDREELALRFQKYSLISAAVVDRSGRLVGMITVDDVVHIISEEAQEDVLKLAGAGEGDVNQPVVDTVRSRLPWLLLNLFTAMLSSVIISQFDATISKLVALAALMPIVSAIGGNAGTQTMTVAVRALATGQLSASNGMRVLFRELRVNGLNAVAVAATMGGVATLWFGCWALGGVMALAMICNFLVAGLVGVLVPLFLARAKADPASASPVFVTAMTDAFGFTAFLGLALILDLGNLCSTCCSVP